MKVLVILSVFFVAAYASTCFTAVEEFCGNDPTQALKTDFTTATCNSVTGHFLENEDNLKLYAETLIEKSYDYLLLAVNFGQFKNNRDGLKSYYRKLSDQAWEDAIDLIKYITKRGGIMKFKAKEQKVPDEAYDIYALSEISSLAKALEIQKFLADEALGMYSKSLKLEGIGSSKHTDGSIAHYLEEKFIEPQMDRVRDLAGHFNDLQKMLKTSDPAISVFMFDEYLKKSL